MLLFVIYVACELRVCECVRFLHLAKRQSNGKQNWILPVRDVSCYNTPLCSVGRWWCQRFVVRSHFCSTNSNSYAVCLAEWMSQNPCTNSQQRRYITYNLNMQTCTWQDVCSRARVSQRLSIDTVSPCTHIFIFRVERIRNPLHTLGAFDYRETHNKIIELRFFVLRLLSPSVMPDMRRLFITRMFIFIYFVIASPVNATAAKRSQYFLLYMIWIVCCFGPNAKWMSHSLATVSSLTFILR